jgi:hypothetical protein
MQEELLTTGEKEILVLKATLEPINSMINYAMLDLHHSDPNSSISFKTEVHQKYFNILLVDFLRSKIYKIGENCVKSLKTILITPQYNQKIESLKKAIDDFDDWLEQEVEFEKDGETRKLWFPTIDCNISLKIKRKEFIEICGNISKHNPLAINRQAELIQKIFENNNVAIELTQALLVIEEFYEQFHNDLLSYHRSVIAEFLNNIRWGIYEYLQPLYKLSVKPYWDERFRMNLYRYDYPEDIKNSYIQKIFWDLMNDVCSKPYMPKFVVTKYLKMRY